MVHANSVELADHHCLCSPPFPRYQQMLIYCQYCTGRYLFISPPRLTACRWRVNATRVQIFYLTHPCLKSCHWRGTAFRVQVLSFIYPRCTAAVARSLEEDERSRANVVAEASASYPFPPTNKTGTCPVTNTTLSFEVDRPDAITVSLPWVNKSPEGI